MKILITGVAGFIGFSLAYDFLKNSKKYQVYGIDSMDNYYSVKLKKLRVSKLKNFKNFKYFNKDITNRASLINFFKKKKFDIIFHFAAQAGVRYSNKQPKKYIKTNIFGFLNILDACINNPPKTIVYASSSSIYGDQKKFPLNEKSKLLPINIYATSKILNEHIAEFYSKNYNTNFIGLRFFTVYGEWGRPDMFLLKIFNCFFKKSFFYLNNLGNHFRDFTYIKDVVIMVKKISFQNNSPKNHEIFNLCSNHPIKLKSVISFLINEYGPIKIKKIKRNSLDVLKTHGDNKLIKRRTNFKKFTSIQLGIRNTFSWYKNYKIYKL